MKKLLKLEEISGRFNIQINTKMKVKISKKKIKNSFKKFQWHLRQSKPTECLKENGQKYDTNKNNV